MLSLLLLLQPADPAPLDVDGVWYTEGGQSQVEITIEDAGPVGRIAWYEGVEEEPVLDRQNPDEAERSKELLGLPLLKGFERAEEKWRTGEIYDPTAGKTYRSAIYRIDEDTLGVEGCVGFICKTQNWALVPEGERIVVEREPIGR